MPGYNHELHKEFEKKINTEDNIKENIFNAIKLYNSIILSENISEYPADQTPLYNMTFPLAHNRHVPDVIFNDYLVVLDNYRRTGNIFTLRYLDSDERYSEIMFLDVNDNGQCWLLVVGPDLGVVENVKKCSYIDLTTYTINDSNI